MSTVDPELLFLLFCDGSAVDDVGVHHSKSHHEVCLRIFEDSF
ncbi:MAG: hypothetical protein ACK559_01305 [bacterium]